MVCLSIMEVYKEVPQIRNTVFVWLVLFRL